MGKLHKKLRDWKQYSKMADLGIIARRKFFNNCFDGALTCAGIVSGIFIIFLNAPDQFTPQNVIVTGFATALAIGISGLWGAFLSEEAERKKKVIDMNKDMAIIEKEEDLEKDEEIDTENDEDITIIQKAEDFATIVASLVDGGAPVLGSSLPLIPFFFGVELNITHFIFSYLILIGLLVYLGNYLGKISGGGRIRYAIHLVTAGVVTLLVSILLGI
jgi:predicted membrane protein (TIGR00267 family)